MLTHEDFGSYQRASCGSLSRQQTGRTSDHRICDADACRDMSKTADRIRHLCLSDHANSSIAMTDHAHLLARYRVVSMASQIDSDRVTALAQSWLTSRPGFQSEATTSVSFGLQCAMNAVFLRSSNLYREPQELALSSSTSARRHWRIVALQVVGNTNSPEQRSQTGPISTNGPPVQPYSILLLALGSCYQTPPGGCMAGDGVAVPLGEYSDAQCQMPEDWYITWSISPSK